MSSFDRTKYLGIWYELMHYPSWFQRNDNYNTTAEYSINSDGTIHVHNSTISQGVAFNSHGKAVYLGGFNFRVDFPQPEVSKLIASKEFKSYQPESSSSPNYVIDKIFTNIHGHYIFAIVTDPKKESLYVLSRYRHPSIISYNEIMSYVIANYNRDRLVQTPHFE